MYSATHEFEYRESVDVQIDLPQPTRFGTTFKHQVPQSLIQWHQSETAQEFQ